MKNSNSEGSEHGFGIRGQSHRANLFNKSDSSIVSPYEVKLKNGYKEFAMPRELRKCLSDVTYHCYSRCIELRDLLSANYVKDMAVEAINQALEKYDFQLIQIEFVENHFHFVIKTVDGGETISRIMQYIKARIAEKYNRTTGRTGPFWNERFKCTIIEESSDPENYFFWLMWYIAYNPVRKRAIRDPRESAYGTLRVYLEENFVPKVKITIHNYFENLGQSFDERVKRFLAYEELYRERLAVVGVRAT